MRRAKGKPQERKRALSTAGCSIPRRGHGELRELRSRSGDSVKEISAPAAGELCSSARPGPAREALGASTAWKTDTFEKVAY